MKELEYLSFKKMLRAGSIFLEQKVKRGTEVWNAEKMKPGSFSCFPVVG